MVVQLRSSKPNQPVVSTSLNPNLVDARESSSEALTINRSLSRLISADGLESLVVSQLFDPLRQLNLEGVHV